MPRLTRWYLKSSLIYLIAALLVEAALVFDSSFQLSSVINLLSPVYFHLLMVGWVTQLIFGVVYWMFPKYSIQKPRGNEALGWLTFSLLNTGLLMRVIGEPLNSVKPGTGWGWLLAVSAVIQWIAGLAFIINTWGRVKEK